MNCLMVTGCCPNTVCVCVCVCVCACVCACACVCGSIDYLLSVSYCTGSLVVGKVSLKRFSLVRFVSLAAVVLAVFAVSFGRLLSW